MANRNTETESGRRTRRYSITTRVGDGGKTRLTSGEKVSKCDVRLEALGAIDELVCALGVARAGGLSEAWIGELLAVQRALFRMGTEVAALPKSVSGLSAEDVSRLDALCLRLEGSGSVPNDFVIPGATESGASLDVARAVARRCERRVLACLGSGKRPHLQAWMNRLSDVLWLLARVADQSDDLPRQEDS